MEKKPNVIDAEVVTETPALKPTPIPPPRPVSKPRLVHDRSQSARVIEEITEMLEKSAPSDEIEIEDLYNSHSERRRSAGRTRVDAMQFIDYAHDFCRVSKLKTRTNGDKVFIRGVRLATERAVAS